MVFQPVLDAAEAVITYNSHNKQVKNVLHAVQPGGYNLTSLTALANAVDVAVAANFLPEQTADVDYASTLVRGLEFENDQEVLITTSAGPGLIAAQVGPGNVTLAVKKSSALTGRSARGRLFWIGMSELALEVNSNFVFQSAVDDIVAAVEAVRIAINATVWTAVIVSRFTGGVKRATGIPFDWLTTSVVDREVDSQRRRLA